MLHVLHVVPALGIGGMELAMSRVIRGLAKWGMRHSVCCLTGEAKIRDQFDEAVQIHCMSGRPYDPGLPFRLGALIRAIRPTVIHARNWGAWPDVALARMMTLPRVPLIFSFHGLDRPGRMPLRRRLAFRVFASITTQMFTVSEASRLKLVRGIGLPAKRIAVIPNGVDTDCFKPGPRPRRTPRFIVGTTGNLTPVKNQSLLVKACADLFRNGLDLELRIAGMGPLKGRLRELAGSLKIAERVRFYGHVADTPTFLHSLDVFALSSDSEELPNALLEAMACGLPCVATRVGGVEEVLDFGRCGLVVEPGERAAMVQALHRLAADGDLRQAMGTTAREQVCQHYSLSRMIAAYSRLYQQFAETVSRKPGLAMPNECARETAKEE